MRRAALPGVVLALVVALSACAPVPSPSGAGASATSMPTSAAPTPRPTAVVDVPIVDSAPTTLRPAIPPVRVQVASVGIDMEVVPVGIESGGFMELPADPAIGGWYRFGPDPWSGAGNTVISAHIDAPDYEIGPFAVLRDLPEGTEVDVAAADGQTARYAIASVTYYPKAELPTEELFARTGTRSLVLITCGGDFDSETGHYADNVVAIATPIG
ncbi:class F sortase [Microbacterium pygmaeum]|uniref:Sortase family protein n=1 Tax=Microbacterium pygmaeum TaxID=370764 RepID=A0A1G7ZTB8_9MICO|nr:class F sortase [Microbacterium pygmaeum]SDH11776.1 Sortase family protein [Microbacterium pygmaeum]